MRNIITLTSLIVVAASCSNDQMEETKKDPNNTISFDSLLNSYYDERLSLYPLEATMAGDSRYDDKLPNNITLGYKDTLEQFYAEYHEALKNMDTAGFSHEQKISHRILAWETDINLEGLEFKGPRLMPVNQFYSLNLTVGQLATGMSAHPFKTVEDYENWLMRLESYNQWLDTAMVNLKKGVEEGFVLPKSLTLKVIPQFADLSQGDVEKHLFFSPIFNMPESFSADDTERLKKAFATMIQDEIMPRYKELEEYIKNDYLAAGRESSGISEIPDGKAYYNYLIKLYTTTNMTADEIFQLGINEVKRITREMNKVKDEVGFEGDLKEFFTHVRTRDELMPFDEPQQVIDHFQEIHERMKPNIPKLFGLTPKTAFEIRRTEAFREASASAEYNPGSVDGTRPGVFYVPIPNVEEYNIFSDEDLFLHEAIPGHHYQVSLTQENQDLPEFRKTLWYSAYGEGWALYSESLGEELGLYEDPYQYFGMLSAEMHRAIRLVVDAGMHAKGWSREKAIQYSLDHEAESEASITSEIERYMAIPGQALSYKIGQLKILQLRDMAEKELGEKFDIRIFHNKVLESGCLPLTILEEKIKAWIASEKTQV